METLLGGMKNILFPSLCFCCNEYVPQQLPLCSRCRDRLRPVGFSKIPSRTIRRHLSAGSPSPDNLSLFSAFEYTPQIKELIHHFKYTAHHRYLSTYISRLLEETLITHALDVSRYDALIPVPMHASKLREREFNHAALVAEALANDRRVLCVPELLSVKRPYPLQAHLSAQERLHNPLNRFALNPACASAYSGKAFILYDDVFTTGSTALSCINELLKLQPAKILILTFAKASLHG